MEDESLFVVCIRIEDSARRRRIRRALRYFGTATNADVWEVTTTGAGLAALQRALESDLAAGDEVRIYPVCARCRSRAQIRGAAEIGGRRAAYVF